MRPGPPRPRLRRPAGGPRSRPHRPTSYIRLSMFDTRASFEDVRRDPDWWEDLAPSRAGLKPRFDDEDPRFVGQELGLLPPPKHPTQPPTHEDFQALAQALRAEAESPANV